MNNTHSWNISNILSASRIILLVPITLFLFQQTELATTISFLLMLIAIGTDFFDGYLARKLNQVTDVGKILDPLADKICIVTVAMTLMILGKIPLWFLLLIFARDVLIFSGGMYVKLSKGILLVSNQAGKWTVTIVTFTILVSLFQTQPNSFLLSALFVLSSVLLVFSFILYLKRFLETIKNTSQN
jgi:CDP-diacylglycerol--glycerol-3-phosphate 3-phosphatidyltransferase